MTLVTFFIEPPNLCHTIQQGLKYLNKHTADIYFLKKHNMKFTSDLGEPWTHFFTDILIVSSGKKGCLVVIP